MSNTAPLSIGRRRTFSYAKFGAWRRLVSSTRQLAASRRAYTPKSKMPSETLNIGEANCPKAFRGRVERTRLLCRRRRQLRLELDRQPAAAQPRLDWRRLLRPRLQ